jgi:Kef-type K+ transport system membrane component KefB
MGSGSDPPRTLRLLIAIVAILVATQLIGRLFAFARQPKVMGEMVAGILLGPSFLGRLLPGAATFLFPNELMHRLRMVAQVGVVLFMFLVGVELDTVRLRSRVKSAIVISFAGIALPLALAVPVASVLYPTLAPARVSRFLFAAFFAVAMSVTAFPVLARIIAERGLEKSPLGVMALTCAAVNDVVAWCLLALVVGFAAASPGKGLVTIGLSLVYVGSMLGVVRPILRRIEEKQETRDRASHGAVLALLVLLVLSSMATARIGVHALFGAFLVGTLVKAESRLAQGLTGKLESVVSLLLLPVFFAFAGLRTELALVTGGRAWCLVLLVIAAAFVGKLGGTGVAALATGMGWRRSAALGALMNTRGLMELVVLNMGLDLGIISPALFAMMVMMALVTTLSAAPLLAWIGHDDA